MTLLPFLIVFISFVIFRLSLVSSSFFALVACILLGFFSDASYFQLTLFKTLETIVEIGLILLGAFFFLEVIEETKILKSLAQLVTEITHVKLYQGILVSFSLAFMIEGSSGFGTPFLIIIPLLLELKFSPLLCVALPFINVVNAIPFGALGTPLRLAFENTTVIGPEVLSLMTPLLICCLFFSAWLIQKSLKQKHAFIHFFWVLLVGGTFLFTSRAAARLGPEFPALVGGFSSFWVGILFIRYLSPEPHLEKIKSIKGLVTYSFLILLMWLGKRYFMDEHIASTSIRIFNPGWLFILFSIALLLNENQFSFTRLKLLSLKSFHRSKRAIFVLFCMTFIAHHAREDGSLSALSLALPHFFKHEGASLLGWLGSISIGTSTVANLLFASVVNSHFHAALAAGSAVGVQLAFQSVVATRGALQNKLTERQIYTILVPISVASILFLTLLSLIRAGVE